MPWIIGIDEAGYGPNLGPLVMTSVACRVPDALTDADLWQVLRETVRRHSDASDHRVLVADSKLVYSPARGLLDLETAVLAMLAPPGSQALLLNHYVDWLCPAAHPELRGEPWYSGQSPLPLHADPSTCLAIAERLQCFCANHQLGWCRVRSVVFCATRFNGLLDEWGSKGAVLAQGLTELLDHNRRADSAKDALCFFVDKHGGRNHYAAMVQHALPGGFVLAQEEAAGRSVYRVEGLEREIRVTFEPRADASHFCVALASMASKYLREVLMREFNMFWQQHVPGLKPTAGYPGDAARFFEDIRPALQRLGIAERAMWRRK